jgi:hypothetical protein
LNFNNGTIVVVDRNEFNLFHFLHFGC